jgi:hypothetical protein
MTMKYKYRERKMYHDRSGSRSIVWKDWMIRGYDTLRYDGHTLSRITPTNLSEFEEATDINLQDLVKVVFMAKLIFPGRSILSSGWTPLTPL